MERVVFTKRLGQLVELRTLPGQIEENSKALDLIESWADSGIEKKRIKNGNAEILLLGTGDLLKPEFGYLVHVDVVSADDSMFKMREEDGKMFGRGVSDMKYSIPLGIELLNNFSRNKGEADLTVAITTDEEVGGGEGGFFLANELKFRPETLIVPDGGDGFVLVNKSKGVAHIWVESKGKSTHASTPWFGKNAIEPIIELAAQLQAKYRVNSEKPNWETTMNLGFVQGGISTNQVPTEALLKIDFRFPETRSVSEIHNEIKELSKKIDKSLKITLAASGDPTFTDKNNPEIKRFIKIANERLGCEIKIEGEEGASDARYWARYNVPIIMMKPEGGGIHSEHEWIDIESCLKFYDILEKYILD